MLSDPQKLTIDVLSLLASHNIHSYGSAVLLKFEKHMARYFQREYARWRDNDKTPDDYGLSSFEGKISNEHTYRDSVRHYDGEYRAFHAFLDNAYMAYTMGYFGTTYESPKIKSIALQTAQENKYDMIIDRADIKDGQTIVDLGCGFGGFSRYLLKVFPNVNIVAINPSDVQSEHIRNELINKDNDFDNSRFRLLHTFFDGTGADRLENNHYDRVISIGLIEHVTNIALLQNNISRVLKQGGKCLHHCIVSYDTIPNFLNSEDSYMGHYYPGAHIWPYNEPRRHSTHLEFVDSWFINGLNYWKTLDEWHRRFWESIEELYPAYLSIEDVGDWNKYFVLCKAMFSPNNGKSYGNGQYLYQKN